MDDLIPICFPEESGINRGFSIHDLRICICFNREGQEYNPPPSVPLPYEEGVAEGCLLDISLVCEYQVGLFKQIAKKHE